MRGQLLWEGWLFLLWGWFKAAAMLMLILLLFLALRSGGGSRDVECQLAKKFDECGMQSCLVALGRDKGIPVSTAMFIILCSQPTTVAVAHVTTTPDQVIHLYAAAVHRALVFIEFHPVT